MRRVLTPRWIGLHVLTVALVVAMVNLGFWQLHRLDDKRAANATIEARATQPPTALAALRGPDGSLDDDADQWRVVEVSGTYTPEGAVTVLNRSADGVAGVHSVVPFRTDDGRFILVNRGFVPLAVATPAPPTGRETLVGWLRPSEHKSALGAGDSTDPTTTQFQRLDVPLIAALPTTAGAAVETMFLHLVEESPATPGDWPARIPLPSLDEGPHLSYAGQWFLFSLVALGGWIVLVVRRLRAPAA